jgi:hypothetical protein
VYRAAGSGDKTMRALEGATHYYAGQPELLAQATDLIGHWLMERRLLEG